MSEENEESPGEENTSGQGKEAVLPDELEGLNWGAFLLNWIWGLGNRTYIALLALIPFVNFVMPFVLLFKGNKWAWANRSWRDADHFRRVQRKWAWAGVIVWVTLVLAGIGLIFVIMSGLRDSDAHVMALRQARQNPEAVKILGEPIEDGWFTSGEITVSGPKGNADISFSVSGPKGEGKLFVSAVRHAGKWRVVQLILEIAPSGERLDVLGKFPGSREFRKGMAALEKRDFKAALKIFRSLSRAGSALARNRLAIMYLNGAGTAKDAAAALELFKRAAAQGHADAQNNVGFIYYEGKGLEKDFATALKWIRLAAGQGHAQAQNNLGVMHANAEGVSKDLVAAYMWSELAAQRGHRGANVLLGKLEKAMNAEQIAEAKRRAGEWRPVTPSVEAPGKTAGKSPGTKPGAAPSRNKPLDLAAIRDVLQRTSATARKLESLAAGGGLGAQLLLGDLHMTGKSGFRRSLAKAQEWYEKAAAGGSAEAQFKLANMYLEAFTQPLSRKALEMLARAAGQGHKEAREKLKELTAKPPAKKPKGDK